MGTKAETPFFVYSERRLILSFLVAFLASIIPSAYYRFYYPTGFFSQSASSLLFLFSALSAVTLVLLLMSRRYEFYSTHLTVEDGLLHYDVIPYSAIEFCKPVFGDRMNFRRGAVIEIRALFRNDAFIIRANPRIPGTRLDLCHFINLKMRKRPHIDAK